MVEANQQRGDVEIILEKQKFVMRPTFEAMIQIENETGLGMVELTLLALQGRLGLRQVTSIVAAGLKATGNPATNENIGPKIFRTGIMNVSPSVNDFLNNALHGGEKPGEAEAADQMKSLSEDSPLLPMEH